MAKKDAPPEVGDIPVSDHVEEPHNNPTGEDNAPHGRRVQGIN